MVFRASIFSARSKKAVEATKVMRKLNSGPGEFEGRPDIDGRSGREHSDGTSDQDGGEGAADVQVSVG